MAKSVDQSFQDAASQVIVERAGSQIVLGCQ
jgi:hypothetical protein